jgi:arabinan endo-1,5-alpha-L-arabinosidase
VAAATAATGIVVATRDAQAAVVDTAAFYVLTAKHSGKALEVYDRATTDGARIAQWSRSDGAWQQWQFVDSGGGWYRLRNRHSTKVLDVPTTADGVQVVQNTDRNDARQQFRLADSAGSGIRLINRNSGKALDVWQWSTADGGQVAQYADLDGANQQWALTRVTGPTAPSTTAPTPAATPTTPPGSYPGPGRVAGDVGVHDPTIVRRPDGSYLLAHTGDNIALKTSADRTTFRNAGAVFPNGASWTTTYTGGSRNLWAPDLTYRDGRYWLYYSASSFGSNRSAIFLATSTTGNAGSWTNQGLVIESRTSDNFNAIDPNLVVDASGRWFLSFGSFWSGIKMIALDPATGKRSDSSLLSIAGRGGGAIEAPVIVRHGNYYYQWVSFDRCCQGAASTYRVMVGRSAGVTGPYVDRNGTAMTAGGGTEVLAGRGSIHGPGHQAVLQESTGDALVYHYYADDGRSLLGINLIGYDAAGWPFVY